MSTGHNSSSSSGRFASKNLNAVTKPRSAETSRGGGGGRLLVLGSKSRSSTGLNAPIPMNTPSLRRENNGQDITVNLVPTGGTGWGADGALSKHSQQQQQQQQQQSSEGQQQRLAPSSRLAPWSSAGPPPQQQQQQQQQQDYSEEQRTPSSGRSDVPWTSGGGLQQQQYSEEQRTPSSGRAEFSWTSSGGQQQQQQQQQQQRYHYPQHDDGQERGAPSGRSAPWSSRGGQQQQQQHYQDGAQQDQSVGGQQQRRQQPYNDEHDRSWSRNGQQHQQPCSSSNRGFEEEPEWSSPPEAGTRRLWGDEEDEPSVPPHQAPRPLKDPYAEDAATAGEAEGVVRGGGEGSVAQGAEERRAGYSTLPRQQVAENSTWHSGRDENLSTLREEGRDIPHARGPEVPPSRDAGGEQASGEAGSHPRDKPRDSSPRAAGAIEQQESFGSVYSRGPQRQERQLFDPKTGKMTDATKEKQTTPAQQPAAPKARPKRAEKAAARRQERDAEKESREKDKERRKRQAEQQEQARKQRAAASAQALAARVAARAARAKEKQARGARTKGALYVYRKGNPAVIENADLGEGEVDPFQEMWDKLGPVEEQHGRSGGGGGVQQPPPLQQQQQQLAGKQAPRQNAVEAGEAQADPTNAVDRAALKEQRKERKKAKKVNEAKEFALQQEQKLQAHRMILGQDERPNVKTAGMVVVEDQVGIERDGFWDGEFEVVKSRKEQQKERKEQKEVEARLALHKKAKEMEAARKKVKAALAAAKKQKQKGAREQQQQQQQQKQKQQKQPQQQQQQQQPQQPQEQQPPLQAVELSPSTASGWEIPQLANQGSVAPPFGGLNSSLVSGFNKEVYSPQHPQQQHEPSGLLIGDEMQEAVQEQFGDDFMDSQASWTIDSPFFEGEAEEGRQQEQQQQQQQGQEGEPFSQAATAQIPQWTVDWEGGSGGGDYFAFPPKGPASNDTWGRGGLMGQVNGGSASSGMEAFYKGDIGEVGGLEERGLPPPQPGHPGHASPPPPGAG